MRAVLILIPSLLLSTGCLSAGSRGVDHVVPSDKAQVEGSDETILDGKVAEIPYQHLIQPIEGKRVEYIDLDSGGQIVAYVPEEFTCTGKARLHGKFIRIDGESKRGDGTPMSEEQIVVSRFECR